MADPAQPRSAGFNTESTRTLLRVVILCLIAAAAITSRLFSVIRKSSLGHRDRLAASTAPISCFTSANGL